MYAGESSPACGASLPFSAAYQRGDARGWSGAQVNERLAPFTPTPIESSLAAAPLSTMSSNSRQSGSVAIAAVKADRANSPVVSQSDSDSLAGTLTGTSVLDAELSLCRASAHDEAIAGCRQHNDASSCGPTASLSQSEVPVAGSAMERMESSTQLRNPSEPQCPASTDAEVARILAHPTADFVHPLPFPSICTEEDQADVELAELVLAAEPEQIASHLRRVDSARSDAPLADSSYPSALNDSQHRFGSERATSSPLGSTDAAMSELASLPLRSALAPELPSACANPPQASGVLAPALARTLLTAGPILHPDVPAAEAESVPSSESPVALTLARQPVTDGIARIAPSRVLVEAEASSHSLTPSEPGSSIQRVTEAFTLTYLRRLSNTVATFVEGLVSSAILLRRAAQSLAQTWHQ